VTTRADFASEEWNRIVRLPRLIVAAASAAQRDVAHRTRVEIEAGLVASARGREIGNAFVSEVAAEALRVFDEKSTLDGVDFSDPAAGIAFVLERASAVYELLKTKADPIEVAVYRGWLLKITDVVISAARSGGFLGFGGRKVTEAEKRFRESLATAMIG